MNNNEYLIDITAADLNIFLNETRFCIDIVNDIVDDIHRIKYFIVDENVSNKTFLVGEIRLASPHTRCSVINDDKWLNRMYRGTEIDRFANWNNRTIKEELKERFLEHKAKIEENAVEL